MADSLEGLDEAALNAKLKGAESYEDRAAIRKALRDLKKSKGIEVGGGRSRGTSQYNRFAGRTSADAKATVKQSFVPSTSSKTPNPPTSTGSSSPSQSVSTPTPPPPTSATPPAEREREEREREEERKEKEREERKERERQERERERERREREREEKEKEKLREEEERREKRRQEREREREERERKEKERKEQEEERERERERQEKEQRERERKEREEKEREERERKDKEERERKEREEKEREERERKEQDGKERESANEGGDDIVTEEEDEVESEQTNKEKEDLWVMVDKEAAKELEKKASIDSTDGRGSDRVQLRKTEPPPTKPRSGTTNTDFGVKLKPRTHSDVTSAPPTDKKSKSLATPTNRTGGGGAPKTLADFQKLTSRGKQSPAGEPTPSNAPKDKRALIRMYVNAALEVRPPVSSDLEFYTLCTRPSNLCKLINKSVRHTVDLRALTKTPPPSASTAEKAEAIEENMLLVVESARAIGCSVTDNMVEELTRGDRATIDKLIMELIKSRVVHLPGMEDEPSSTFNDLSTLMSKLGLTYTDSTEANGGTGTDSRDGGGGGGVSRSWRDKGVSASRPKDGGVKELRTDDEYTPHSDTGSWREEKKTPEIDLSKPSLDANLSYEERAAIRRAERERRKKEREGLAVPK